MKQMILIAIAVAQIALTGCASLVAKEWRTSQMAEARTRRALYLGLDADVGGPVAAIDISNIEYLKENPGTAAVAALADIGTGIVGWNLATDATADNSGSDTRTVKGNNKLEAGGDIFFLTAPGTINYSPADGSYNQSAPVEAAKRAIRSRRR